MTIIFLAIAGLALGSFVNALVWRIYQQEFSEKGRKKSQNRMSIFRGRSMCVHCKRELKTKDLIPVISWLWLRGKCRDCRQPISWQYPLVELSVAALFVVSYLFWPGFQGQSLQTMDYVGFGVWLAVLTGLVALVVYDFRWMLLPNRIIFPLFALVGLNVVFQSIASGSLLLVTSSAFGLLIGGGLFYVLFQLSGGRWIGGGDVKLGFLLGAIVGGPWMAFFMLFLASLLGVIASLPLLISGKLKRGSHIPFGPFLIIAAIIIKLFGSELTNWYFNAVL